MKKSVAKFIIFSIFMGTVSGSVAGAGSFCGFRNLGEDSSSFVTSTRASSDNNSCASLNNSVVEAQVDAKLCKEKVAKVEEDIKETKEELNKLKDELKDHKEKDYHGYGFKRGGWWKNILGNLQSSLVEGLICVPICMLAGFVGNKFFKKPPVAPVLPIPDIDS